MSDFLTQLLQAVITAAIPVCGAFLIQFLNRKSDQIAAETDSIELKALIAQVDDAVSKAVTYTTQTFVDSMKKNGVFDAEAQKEALKKSLDKTMALLSEVANSALEEIYGDLQDYLTVRIEAEVKTQKGTPTAVLNVTGTETDAKSDAETSERYAQLISELLGMSLDDLKTKADEYGVATDGLSTKKEIAEAIVVAILNQA